MSEDIKPCPFCGGEPYISDDGIEETHDKAILCECGVGTHYAWTVEDAVFVWNRRADSEEVKALREKLAELEKKLGGRK